MGASVALINFLSLNKHNITLHITKLCYFILMFTSKNTTTKLSKQQEIQIFLDKAREICKKLSSKELEHLHIYNYRYTVDVAVNELGLDEELIYQLIDDYVTQIIKTKAQFTTYIQDLQDTPVTDENYKLLRELAHKNLGVAKNLRILDAQKLLSELLQKDDLNYLMLCLEVLEACAVRLSPECAYDTMKLIEIKNHI